MGGAAGAEEEEEQGEAAQGGHSQRVPVWGKVEIFARHGQGVKRDDPGDFRGVDSGTGFLI